MKDPAFQMPRAVSPALTETPDELPIEHVISNLEVQGIEIRDFASQEELRKLAPKPFSRFSTHTVA